MSQPAAFRNNWRLGDRPELGAMNTANSLIRAIDIAAPDNLPNLSGGRTFLIGSDFSGQHSTSQFEAYGFIFACLEECGEWLAAQKSLRTKYLPDGRRISYKSLRDRRRASVMPHFFSAADLIPGLLVVILVDRKVGSLFKPDSNVTSKDPEVQLLANWRATVIEKVLRVCHFAAFFLAGLSREMQDVLWVTDEDEIIPNESKHYEFVEAFARISSHYLTHTVRHVRLATTSSDTGKRDLEDYVAISDLAAGGTCEILNSYRRESMDPVSNLVIPVPNSSNDKATNIMKWFAQDGALLKRLVISFESEPESTRLKVRHYGFHNTPIISA